MLCQPVRQGSPRTSAADPVRHFPSRSARRLRTISEIAPRCSRLIRFRTHAWTISSWMTSHRTRREQRRDLGHAPAVTQLSSPGLAGQVELQANDRVVRVGGLLGGRAGGGVGRRGVAVAALRMGRCSPRRRSPSDALPAGEGRVRIGGPRTGGNRPAAGASRLQLFWHVSLPLARKGLASGMILAFARALGEFGATMMVFGWQSRRVTLPVSNTPRRWWSP